MAAGNKDDSGRRRRRRFAVSVRTRIVATITVVITVGLFAVGLSVYLVERQRILEQVDARLHANLESAHFIVESPDPEAGPWASSSDALAVVVQRMSPDDNTGAMGLVNGVITFVPGFDLDLDLQYQGMFAAHVDRELDPGEAIIGTYAERGVAWRYLATTVSVEGSSAPEEVVFVMVYDLHAELAEFNEPVRMFVIASLIVIVVVAATGTIVATRLLRPLRQMRTTAERISAQNLNERLDIVGNDDVAELAETMNAMLDRIDAALDSQRQLLSDVGHELKTPITIVRGNIEVMNPDDPTDARETRALAMDELDRMADLVQDLAGAAALHGPRPIDPHAMDVAELLAQIARKASGIDGADVSVADAAGGTAMLDSARITQAMLQLAQNVVTHADGRMEIGVSDAGEHVQFWVRDFGPGVPEHAKSQIFERFHRGSNAADKPGSGLGLNIVQVIARAHGGTVRVADAVGGGAVFVLSLPRGAGPTAEPPPDGPVIPPRPPLPGPDPDPNPDPDPTPTPTR
ncbi:sensor histidine kinase [Microbacterium sp. A82]|uniref:sensor histidine kinase n=1 Tax=Microbacterium sp. A82 TaxID=3450452 RepID=UPI003F398EE8